MTSILNDLGAGTPAAQPTDIPAESTGAAPETGSDPLSNFPLLKNISEGRLPGVLVPTGFPAKQADGLDPKTLADAGLGIYKPASEGFEAAIFNSSLVAVSELQRLDKEGELTTYFPSLDQFFPESSRGAEEPVADAQATENGPTTNPVPVLPSSTFGNDAQKKAAEARMKSLVGPSPSKRPMPGAGTVLNGLLKQSI